MPKYNKEMKSGKSYDIKKVGVHGTNMVFSDCIVKRYYTRTAKNIVALEICKFCQIYLDDDLFALMPLGKASIHFFSLPTNYVLNRRVDYAL